MREAIFDEDKDYVDKDYEDKDYDKGCLSLRDGAGMS